MAATLFIPEVATPHAQNLFFEIMEFMSEGLGIVDYGVTDSFAPADRGQYIRRPRIGRLAGGTAERAVVSSLSSSATVRSTTNTDENMVAVHRQKLTDFYDYETKVSGVGNEAYSLDIGRQMAMLFTQALKVDLYNTMRATAEIAAIDHDYSVYVDTATAANQVDMTVDVIQAGKFRMTDWMESLDVGVCSSKQWNDLRVEALTDANFAVWNVVGDLYRGQLYRNVLGATWIVDDQVPTVAGSNATRYNAFLLRSRSRNPYGLAPLMVQIQTPLYLVTQHVLGEQSARRQIQGFSSWAIGARGASWDLANANPTDAQIQTSTNWDNATQDDDEYHGIIEIATN